MERLAVDRKDLALGERDSQPLGHLGGALAVGSGQDHRELLAAPARRHVDLTDGVEQEVGEVAQDDVAGGMAEAVVDRLEVVHVGEDQADGAAEPLGARELGRQRLVRLPPVREPRETVDERLPLGVAVQARVLERDDRLARERGGCHPLLDVEVVAHQEQAPVAAPACSQLEREPLAARIDVAGLDRRPVLGDHDTAVRLRRLDGRLDDHAPELFRVERGRERLAEAHVRLTQSPPLVREVGHPRLELLGHLVERAAQRGELVTSADGDALLKPAGGDRVRGLREP